MNLRQFIKYQMRKKLKVKFFPNVYAYDLKEGTGEVHDFIEKIKPEDIINVNIFPTFNQTYLMVVVIYQEEKK